MVRCEMKTTTDKQTTTASAPETRTKLPEINWVAIAESNANALEQLQAHADKLAEALKVGIERLEWHIAMRNERGQYVPKFEIDAEEQMREALAAYEGEVQQ
jgi:hypothetical protein